MPLVEFPYRSFSLPPSPPFPNGQVALRPNALATLTAPTGRRLRCVVCLDSGADSCVFPESFVPVLGLDFLGMPRHFTGGVGSSANLTAYSNLMIDLGSGIQCACYAGFTPGMNALGIGLLGQSGFFDSFNVCFYQKARKFTIETA
jgi:hypothetical protein